MADGALSTLRVLELNKFLAAPYCTKFLAGCGAEVIKIEPPGGEPTRALGPFKDDVPHPETSAPFLFLNTSKKSVTLDPSTPTGHSILLQLIQESDILVTDLEPRALEDLHLDYLALEKTNPRLIMAAISFFGQTGPYRDYRANEFTGFAMGGYLYITGQPDREPVKVGGNTGQYQGGLHAAVGIMGAVMYRQLTGLGQLVDVSITESLSFEADAADKWMNQKLMSNRVGNRQVRGNAQGTYPAQTLPCKDGWVHVHHARDLRPGFKLLAEVIGEPRLNDPEVVDAPYGHADLIDELFLPWLSRNDKFEVVRQAQAARHPFMEVLDIQEVLADPQHAARGYFVEVDHPVVGRMTQLGAPLRASETPWETQRSPLLGEHNEEVYCGRLGYTSQELSRLRERGVI